MAVNKVVMNTENGEEILMDLTNDTVTPSALAEGETAHDKSGALIVGTATPVQLVQELGEREDAVVSQKVVTQRLNDMNTLLGGGINVANNNANEAKNKAEQALTKADAIVVPTLLSQLSGDSTHRLVTDVEKQAWNNKVDKSNIVQELGTDPNAVMSQKAITDEFAKRGQLAPEYANSIEECTDTTKMYVLPDGYIYAYMLTKVQQDGYTNLADPSSVDWLTDKRFSTSSISDEVGGIITNYISCKKGDTVRVKGLNITTTLGGSRVRIRSYKGTSKIDNGGLTAYAICNSGNGSGESGGITTVILTEGTNSTTNAELDRGFDSIRLNGVLMSGYTVNDVIITVNEEIGEGISVDAYAWANTGLAFVSADYGDRISNLENVLEEQGNILDDLESAVSTLTTDGVDVPSYWLSELETKADAIQQAMEVAGRNKSAFLWYTDAHWVNGNSKVSPKLLNYLYMNTPMNKVNFGGDIIGDSLLATREDMKYLYEWRKAIRHLPNHHSVLGNHDMFDKDSVDYEDDNYRYAFLIAPEETPDMVMGDGNYYYIDNHCEKTRYLYLAWQPSDHTKMTAQGKFIVEALKSTPEGWHIVAIAHRWWQYSSSSTPTVGSVHQYDQEILSVFDAYNARGTRSGSNYFSTQDFSDAKGKVEFCIGGHIHIDYDFSSEGGIPIIVTTADANQNRVPDSTVDCGTLGTITESAVFGIIADYNNSKITIVGVGRGTSREISY